MSMKEVIQGFWRMVGVNQRRVYLEHDVILLVHDDGFELQDGDDPTKRAVFQLGGITPGATRIMTLPDADVTISGGGEGGSGTPGGANTQVQFNGASTFAGDPDFTYTTANNTLHVETIDLVTPVSITDGGTGGGDATTAQTNLGVRVGTHVQAWDSDLDTISSLGASNNDVIQRKSGGWAASPPATLKTDLALTKADVGLGNVDNTSNATERTATKTLTNTTLTAPVIGDFSNAVHNHVTNAGGGLLTVNALSDVSASGAELSIMDGVLATTAEINKLSGLTASTAELSRVTGVTSPIQAQIDGKQAADADLLALAGLTATTDNMIQSVASAWASRTPAQVKTALALDLVTNTSDANKPVSTAQQTALDGKQNLDPDLTTIAGLTATTDNMIQSVGSAWASRTPAEVRTALSLVPGTNVQAYDADLAQIAALVDPNADRLLFWDDSASAWTHLTAGTGLTISGTTIAADGGIANNPTFSDYSNANHDHLDTDDGGTLTLAAIPAITATAAQLNFSVGVTSAIQTQIDGKQAADADLTTIAGLTPTTNNFMVANASAWASRTPAEARVHLGLDADLATFSLPASTTISTFGASLVDDADATAAKVTLGLNAMVGSFGIAVGDPSGAVIGTGTKGYLSVPFACTITGWRVINDLSSTTTWDVWKVATGTTLPANANTITASAKPLTSAATIARSTTLTGWTTSVAALDIIGFEIEANNNAKWSSVSVEFTRVL